MNLFRWMRRQPQPLSNRQWQVRNQPGPITAHEGWNLVWSVAKQLDPAPQLTFITSGLDISHEGRSFVWEFTFHLPKSRAWVFLSLEPLAEAGEPDNAPIVLVQRTRPVNASDTLTVLPHHFRDSSEVVAEFAEGGVDFISGPSDMKLETKVLPSGEPVWLTYDWGSERTAIFSAEPVHSAS